MRLIPAHAGKTNLHYASCTMYRAHPRSRGENHVVENCFSAHFGSSPLTRGKRASASILAEREGLIPAHAGKTCPHPGMTRSRAAHPRSRGENWSLLR